MEGTSQIKGSKDKFKEGDRVFGKLRGYPYWPAQVRQRIAGNVEIYDIIFYGTYETSKLKVDSILEYNDETKAKHGKQAKKRLARFSEALQEVEEGLDLINGAEIQPSESTVVPEIDPPTFDGNVAEDDDDEGGLVIDEGAPPLLTREDTPEVSVPVKTPELKQIQPTSKSSGGPPPPKLARRGSRGTNKRDSISSVGISTPTTETQPSTLEATPQIELTSRSGRKIKPKRFADEDESTPVTSKSTKNTADLASKTTDSTPSTKRRGSANASAVPPSIVPNPQLALNKITSQNESESVETIEQGSGRPKRSVRRTISIKGQKITTENNEDVKGKESPATSKAASSRQLPALRQMPSLIPAPSVSKKGIVQEKVSQEKDSHQDSNGKEEITTESDKAIENVVVKVEDDAQATIGTNSNEINIKDVKVEEKPIVLKNELIEEDDGNARDQENENKKDISGSEQVEVDSETQREDEIHRIKVDLPITNLGVVLSIQPDPPQSRKNTEESEILLDSVTAEAVLEIKANLETNGSEFLQEVENSYKNETNKMSDEHKEKINKSEKVAKKIAQNRLEGELLEITGQLVASLGVRHAYCDQALDLLDSLGSKKNVNTLALRKHPEVVNVIRKVQNYHGNVGEWPQLTQSEIDEFHVKAEMIREKAISIYQSFKQLFCYNTEKPFFERFTEETSSNQLQTESAPIPNQTSVNNSNGEVEQLVANGTKD